MVELIILILGLLITGILALVKVIFVLTTLSWFWVWVPTFVAVVIVCGIWLPDWDLN